MDRYTFKAKRKDNGEWVYGYYMYSQHDDKDYIFTGNNGYGLNDCREFEYYETIPETLCQCTGLQDRDGKDIFENDIIDINQTVNGCNLFKIVWDKYKWNAEYYVKMVTPRLYEYNFEELLDINDFEKDIKIIGNKFDKEED